ncbi:MAG: DNA gyrase [Rhizobium sp.]|nr:DNA gyrase [Rhizobium sp.]
MNLAVRPSHLSMTPSSRDLMDRALEPHLLIGMPHMTPHGLSETWLMKELGHRHWLMLARDLGMDNADFRTIDGEEAYAAICATSLTAARFNAVRANDILTIQSRISPLSRTQTSTTHVLSVAGGSIGHVELISAFVRRQVKGCNRSITRVTVAKSEAKSFGVSPLAQQAADIRNGRLQTHWELPLVGSDVLRSFRFDPSITQDFNGAGLFYFAEFQAVADRALETWYPGRKPVGRRDVFFLGNTEPNESVSFDLLQSVDQDETFHGEIRRHTGEPIAKVFISAQNACL